MDDATGNLSKIADDDCQRAVTAISEAVWWATIVDATLVRHHLQASFTVTTRAVMAPLRNHPYAREDEPRQSV